MNMKDKQMKLMSYLFQKTRENIRECVEGAIQFIILMSNQAGSAQIATGELISMKFLEK